MSKILGSTPRRAQALADAGEIAQMVAEQEAAGPAPRQQHAAHFERWNAEGHRWELVGFDDVFFALRLAGCETYRNIDWMRSGEVPGLKVAGVPFRWHDPSQKLAAQAA